MADGLSLAIWLCNIAEEGVMGHISWGTMGRVLREAEHALGSPNQTYAAQKLAKAIRYVNAVHSKVPKEPRRYAGRDVERLQRVVDCLRDAKLRAPERKGDLSGYLAQGLTIIKALREVTGSFTRGAR